jgi:hypothetical protein
MPEWMDIPAMHEPITRFDFWFAVVLVCVALMEVARTMARRRD